MTKADLINLIISRRGYRSYLEIGVDAPFNTFNNIRVHSKIGVDPYEDNTQCHQWDAGNREAMIQAIEIGLMDDFHFKTSDEFFAGVSPEFRIDIAFIDGLHLEDQVDRDIQNCLKHLNPNGMILIDDCCPNSWQEALENPVPRSAWRGTVYRSFWKLRRKRANTHVLGVIHELNVGFMMPRPKGTEPYAGKWADPKGMTNEESYAFYRKYRHRLMNEIYMDSFRLRYL